MKSKAEFDFDMIEIEAHARQLRAEAIRHGWQVFAGWAKSLFQGARTAPTRQAS